MVEIVSFDLKNSYKLIYEHSFIITDVLFFCTHIIINSNCNLHKSRTYVAYFRYSIYVHWFSF